MRNLLLTILLASSCAFVYAQTTISIGPGVQTNHLSLSTFENIRLINGTNFYFSFNPSIGKENSRFRFNNDFQFGIKSLSILKVPTPAQPDEMINDFLKLKSYHIGYNPHIEYEVFYRFSLLAGMYSNVRIGEQVRFGSEDWTMNENGPISNNFDVGYLLGFKGNIDHFYLSVSYLHGFADAFSVDQLDIGEDLIAKPPVQYRNIQVGIGYRI